MKLFAYYRLLGHPSPSLPPDIHFLLKPIEVSRLLGKNPRIDEPHLIFFAIGSRSIEFVVMQTSDLRLRLRSETATAHKNLETLLDIMSPSLEATRYTQILETFTRVHLALESQLAELTHFAFAAEYLRERRKLSWLATDLAACALAPAVDRDTPDFSWIKTEADLFGALYVIEGSTLGGQVVSKHLRSLPDIPSTRYFESYGAETGRNWQKFAGLLAERPAQEHDAIVAAADRMFVAIAGEFENSFSLIESR